MSIFSRVEFDTKWSLFVLVGPDDFACFGVPQIDCFVEGSAEEFTAVVVETNISDCFVVTHVGSNAFSVGHDIPNLTCAIVASAQQQMAKFGEEFDSLDTPVMARPRMNPFLWDKAIVFFVPQIRRCLNKSFTCVDNVLAPMVNSGHTRF